MKGCNYIKKRIDEADKPDLLTFEVAEHIGRCDDCSSFAIERAGLRKLLASDVRVSAPMNFDAMLKTRLAEAKARGSSSWLRASKSSRFAVKRSPWLMDRSAFRA